MGYKVQGRDFEPYIPARPYLREMQKVAMKHTYKGIHFCKDPYTTTIYQLLLWQLKPRTIIEIGTKRGGSALWFRDMTRGAMGLDTHIVTMDPYKRPGWNAKGITFLSDDVRDVQSVGTSYWLDLARPWLVIEDSSHHYDVVRASVDLFSPMMEVGEYLVIEDGIMEAWGNSHKYDGGPPRVIQEFLSENSNWSLDTRLADYWSRNLNWAVNGWLRKDK